jgi:PKD repeat protein
MNSLLFGTTHILKNLLFHWFKIKKMKNQFKNLEMKWSHFMKLCLLLAFLLNGNFTNAQVQDPDYSNDPTINFQCSHVARAKPKRLNGPTKNHQPKRSKGLVGVICLTNAELAKKKPDDLVVYLKTTTDYDCLSGVFFNSYDPKLYTTSNIEAVIVSIEKSLSSYDGTFSNGYYGLFSFLHAAIYYDFSYQFMSPALVESIGKATDAVCQNPRLFDLNEQAAIILVEFLTVLDKRTIRHRPETLKLLKKVFNLMTVDRDNTWNKTADSNFGWFNGYWKAFVVIERLFREDMALITNFTDLNEITTQLGNIANDTVLKNREASSIGLKKRIINSWVKDAIIELKEATYVPQLADKAFGYLAQVCTTYPRLNMNWFSAIIAISEANKCAQFNLCKDTSITALKLELTNTLFPNTYSYDDGKIVFKGKLTKTVADQLYYATRQVQSQFFRMAQTDKPVTNDKSTNLTAIIFESKVKYDEYATFLYGISTNNGGMYIEERVHFYTWDRPVTYSLSLEDLFRHEFSHYLQDRYLIPGLWGETFYDNSRLVWYEEGNADFMVGSTDFEGIKLKKSTVDGVLRDVTNWPTLKMVLSSSYSDPNPIHYVYGNLLWYMWYKTDFGKIKQFHDLTIKNDIANFDILVNSLKNSVAAQNQWVTFLTSIKNGQIQPWQPSTKWMDDQYLTVGKTTDIDNEFKAITGKIVKSTVDANGTIKRFKITGTISGVGKATDNASAALSVNTALDRLMTQLKTNPYIRNFHFSTAYYSSVGFKGGLASATYTLIGSLRNAAVGDTPVADFSAKSTASLVGTPVSYESLVKGYVKGYSWTVAGNTQNAIVSISDTAINPNFVFTKIGEQKVSLALRDKNGVLTAPKTGIVNVYEPSNLSYCLAANTQQKDYQGGIARVAIKNINNTSIRDSTGYDNHTRKVITEIAAGVAQPISFDLQYTNAPEMSLAVWIDYNQNGLFTDANEQCFVMQIPQSVSPTTLNNMITIPKTAKNGVTRMRVRLSYRNSTIRPCGEDVVLGEVEDYTIVVTDGDATPVPVVPPETPISACAAAHGYNYAWISQVKLNTLAITRTPTDERINGYTDLAATLRTNLTAGTPYPINVDLSYTNAPYIRIGVWVDLNQNGSFLDQGEQLLMEKVGQLKQLSGATITIPANTPNGTKRMRIRAIYDDLDKLLLPCGSNPYMGGIIDISVVTSSDNIFTKN